MLMYVAVTRAEKMLFLCESEGYMNDTGALKYPSRFFSEVPDWMLKLEGVMDPTLMEGTRQMVAMLREELGGNSEKPLEPGTRVSHKIFGQGVIEAYDASSKSYKVRFGESTRNLLLRVLTVI